MKRPAKANPDINGAGDLIKQLEVTDVKKYNTGKSIPKVTAIAMDNYTIRFDGDLVCLNDLHAAAGSPQNQTPYEWSRLPSTRQLIDNLAENLHTGKSRIYKVSKARVDRGGGTWGHKLLAVEYSGYLSPELRLKINETFLRAESGDVSLAAEIAEKASPEDRRRLKMRIDGIPQRNALTAELSVHQVHGKGFALCTDGTYIGGFGATARELREQRKLPAKANVRDAMTADELAVVTFAEVVARKRLEADQTIVGNIPCAQVCELAAANVQALLPK